MSAGEDPTPDAAQNGGAARTTAKHGRNSGRPKAKQVSSPNRADRDRIAKRTAVNSVDGDQSRPALSEDADPAELDQEVRKELATLPKRLADLVGSHLVMAARLLDEDPQLALAHTRFARSKASRVAAVREAAGLAAYVAGEWTEALAELRAARRLGGDPGRLAVLADCERALGRPERALELARSPEAGQLGVDEAVELRIVAAGARRDLGQFDAAVVALQGADLETPGEEPWRARLRYAYADNLLAAGRQQDALHWFLAAADADVEDITDAAQRAVELSERPDAE